MAAKGRRTDSGIDKALLGERPFDFDFFQAVRLLSRVYPKRNPVARDGVPDDEIVRFRGSQNLTFPPSAIHDIEEKPEGPPHMTVSFMGLIGSQGVLPFHYTEFLQDRRFTGRDTAAADFFDLFLHRLVSFFYRAWEKHSIAVQYEQALTGRAEENSDLKQYLFDLIGVGTDGLRSQAPSLEGQALIFYSGLNAQRPHSASALEGMLGDYFQVPVRVEQFRGKWFVLDPSEYSDIQTNGAQNRLGEGATAGDAVWHPQARIRLHLGPLTWKQFRSFLPGGKALPGLIALTRFFLDWSVDFDLQLYLLKTEVPELELSDEASKPPALGLSTWLKTSEFQEDARDVIISSAPGMTVAHG